MVGSLFVFCIFPPSLLSRGCLVYDGCFVLWSVAICGWVDGCYFPKLCYAKEVGRISWKERFFPVVSF